MEEKGQLEIFRLISAVCLFTKMKIGEVCETLKKKGESLSPASQQSCGVGNAGFRLLRFSSQIKKTGLSSYWSFGFLLVE